MKRENDDEKALYHERKLTRGEGRNCERLALGCRTSVVPVQHERVMR